MSLKTGKTHQDVVRAPHDAYERHDAYESSLTFFCRTQLKNSFSDSVCRIVENIKRKEGGSGENIPCLYKAFKLLFEDVKSQFDIFKGLTPRENDLSG